MRPLRTFFVGDRMKWYLWVMLFWPGQSDEIRYHEFPTQAQCERALESMRLELTPDGESEWAATVYCAPDGYRVWSDVRFRLTTGERLEG
jgi:hypothetical protein